MRNLPPVSESELTLLQIIWAQGGTALYAQIMGALEQNQPTWKKNTVLTLLSRLVEKGYVTTSKLGRRNAYTALISDSDYQTGQTKTFVEKIYQGNVKGLVSTLLEQEILSADDLAELSHYWQEVHHE